MLWVHSNDFLELAAAAADTESDSGSKSSGAESPEESLPMHTFSLRAIGNSIRSFSEEKDSSDEDQENAPLKKDPETLSVVGEDDETSNNEGSSKATVYGCAINVTNAIMGAGCIGYGGAMAKSGGFITLFLITFFGILMKRSYDLLIELVLLTQANSTSPTYHKNNVSSVTYENLAIHAGCGRMGLIAVMASKGLYALGCMVAYVVIVRDNLAFGCHGLYNWLSPSSSLMDKFSSGAKHSHNELGFTLIVCVTIMLPLCLLRNITLLQKFSSAKIALYGIILVILAYLFVTLPPDMQPQSELVTFYEKWLQIRPGILQSVGTIVLSFATANIHIYYRSLHVRHRNKRDWATVTSICIGLSYGVFSCLALFAYMTYWEETTSDLLLQYPPNVPIVSVARVLLSVSMLFTYPMPMFALREIVAMCLHAIVDQRRNASANKTMTTASSTTTISDGDGEGEEEEVANLSKSTASETDSNTSLPQDSTRTITWGEHVALTLGLWTLSILLAISGPSLGQVLNLIGCISGAMLGFILPATFSYRLQGTTTLGTIFFIVGGFVGIVGTMFSFKDLLVGTD